MPAADRVYKIPDSWMGPKGPKYAFVTFIMRNGSYLPGALVLASGLRKASAGGDLVCLVTGSVTGQAKSALAALYDKVVDVDEAVLPHARRQERQDRPFLFTRFNALRLGADGDLGCSYEKIVVLDSDILPLRNYGHLFTLGTPAGIINERKEHCLEASPEGRFLIPPGAMQTGKWVWHQVYEPICPHGQPIDRSITDRVLTDPTNMGVNACLWVLRPSMDEYLAIMEDVERPEVLEQVSNWSWPEMQYATARWSGQWKNVDLRFASFSGYPSPRVVFGIHFAGLKPWSIKKKAALERWSRYEDFQLWYREYQSLMAAHPELRAVGRLRRLLEEMPAPRPDRGKDAQGSKKGSYGRRSR